MLTWFDRMRSRPKGFTLIELVIAVVLVSFIGGTVYMTFSQGLKLWSHASRMKPDTPYEILLEKMIADLRNGFIYKPKRFKGTGDSFEFYLLDLPGRIRERGGNRVNLRVPFRVRYFFDREKSVLNRSQEDFPEILYASHIFEVPFEPLVEGLGECVFAYYFSDPQNQNHGWAGTWDGEGWPKAIRITLKYDDENKVRVMERIIPVPIGGLPPKEEQVEVRPNGVFFR